MSTAYTYSVNEKDWKLLYIINNNTEMSTVFTWRLYIHHDVSNHLFYYFICKIAIATVSSQARIHRNGHVTMVHFHMLPWEN